MAYNHGREDRKWRIWKEAEEKILRECGIDEAVIEQIRTDDREESVDNFKGGKAKGSGRKQCMDTSSFMEQIISRDNPNAAYLQVVRNKGAAGIDGMAVEELGAYLLENGESIKEQLRTRKYKPHPVRRVEIPKPDGGTRNLGVPTVVDRFVQQAVSQVQAKDVNFQSILAAMTKEQLVDSMQYYVKTYDVKYVAAVETYNTLVGVFFDFISSTHGWKNPLFETRAKNLELKAAYDKMSRIAFS